MTFTFKSHLKYAGTDMPSCNTWNIVSIFFYGKFYRIFWSRPIRVYDILWWSLSFSFLNKMTNLFVLPRLIWKTNSISFRLFHKPIKEHWTLLSERKQEHFIPHDMMNPLRSLTHFSLSLFRSHQLTRVLQRSVRRRHQRATFVSLGQSVTRILRTCGESQTHATAFQGPDVLFFREPEGFRNMGLCLMVCIRCRVFCRPVSLEFLFFLALILMADKVYGISLWYITAHSRGCVLCGVRCSK